MKSATGALSQEKTYRRVLSIAGSDSGGGAGIQADMKTISALGCYAMSALTAVRAQNTVGVASVHALPAEFVGQQIAAVLDDMGADAVKIGMLFSSEIMEEVSEKLSKHGAKNLVVDPVMVARSGDRLLLDSGVKTLRSRVIPMARVITPNIPETEALLSRSIRSEDDMFEAAKDLVNLGCENALVTGGHGSGVYSTDVLYLGEEKRTVVLRHMRLETNNFHGTGCTLSSAVAAYLAQGLTVEEAVSRAREYVQECLQAGKSYVLGAGHGPVHHFHAWWS